MISVRSRVASMSSLLTLAAIIVVVAFSASPRLPVSLAFRAGQAASRPLPASQSAPATIRVCHDERNNKWSGWPVGEARVFDFEYYVKHVIPYEIGCSWPLEAIKAQATAARTYGWYKILNPYSATCDVTDYANTQMFGPDTAPRCEQAVDETRGQYIAYNGQIIIAQYSAENGDPTLDAAGVSYLRSVEDPVSFGTVRNGHGHGLSQWGAYRWAGQYVWDYQKILMHYYSGVSIEQPQGALPDAAPPVSSIVSPWSGWYFTGSRIFIRANASDASSGVSQAEFSARFGGGAPQAIGSDSTPAEGWTTVWDVSAVADQPPAHPISLDVTSRDVAGNAAGGSSAAIGLDRQPPSLSAGLDAPYSGGPSVALRLSGSDAGSGLASMALSNDWLWEGEALPRWTGAIVSDSDALNGTAWRARAGIDPPGNAYGPFTTVLPAGQYRAYFRLKTTGALVPDVIARLDVITSTGSVIGLIGLHEVRGGDFRAGGQYQEFAVEFAYPVAGQQLEFRTNFLGVEDVYLDRVLVVAYPTPFAATTVWQLASGPLPKTIRVKGIDAAGNVSPDAIVVVGGPTPSPTATPTRTQTPPAGATGTATRTGTAMPASTPTHTKTPEPPPTPTNTRPVQNFHAFLPVLLGDNPRPTSTATAGPTADCTPSIVTAFATGREPHGIALAPGRIYVANFSGQRQQGTVSVLDRTTGQAVATPIPVGLAPNGVAYNPTNRMIYVANRDSNSITVIDSASNQIVTSIMAGSMPDGLAVDPIANRIYVANWGSNDVSVIDGATNMALAGRIPTGNEPAMVAVNPLTHMVYVSNHGSSSVTMIRGADNTVLQTIALPDVSALYGITANSAANRVYVVGIVGGRMAVIDGLMGSILSTTAPPGGFRPWQAAADEATNHVIVTSSAGGSAAAYVYDDSSGQWQGAALPLGAQPEQGIAADEARGRIYITNAGSDSITVVQDCLLR